MSNTKLVYFIDENHNFSLEFSYSSGKLDIEFISYYNSSNYFRDNFLKLLSIKNKDKVFFFDTPFISLKVDNYQSVEIFIDSLDFLAINLDDFQLIEKFRKLVVFETRLIGRYKNNYIPIKIENKSILHTDLHTHLSGEVSSDALIEIGLKHNILYPTEIFDKLKIKYKLDNLKKVEKLKFIPTSHINTEKEYVNSIYFRDLEDVHLKILRNYLSLSPETQSTFEDIENCYYRREPFTKNLDLLEDILDSIAKEYKLNNVKYAELSSNSVLEGSWLKKIEAILPAIETKYDIQIRFLVGLPRNFSKEKLRKRISKILKIYHNKYIVGVDLLGYEINKTKDFERKLKTLVNIIKNKKDNFIFRIHAGENFKNPNNVKEALYFAIEHQINIRIGHALYGIDEEALYLAKLLSKKDLLTIEFNPDSNLASNNIDFPEEMPIKIFTKLGVKSVLGSDGCGLYQTSAKQLAIVGKICGLSDSDFNFISKVEKKYISNSFSSYKLPEKELITTSIDLGQRTPIFIAGSKGSSWVNLSLEDKKVIKEFFNALISNLNPNKYFFITGRSKDSGIAVELGKLISVHNFEHNNKFLFMNIISESDTANTYRPIGISHIKNFSTPLLSLPSDTISYIKKNKGIAIFIGGKSFTRDFIVEAYKQNIIFALMENIQGASNQKARIYNENSFKDFSSLRKLLAKFNIEI